MEVSSTLNSPTVVYTPVSQRNAQTSSRKAEYRLERYLWRSFLTVTGPLVVLAFYTFICFHFLAQSLSNNIFPSSVINATWIYFGWFVIAVFSLDWSKSALANIEASALMIPRVAPSSAAELMWHTDAQWGNPLWWFSALRSVTQRLLAHRRPRSQPLVLLPGRLWVSLSSIHIILFIALPLSGLSMEMADAFTYDTRTPQIFGPGASSFNSRGFVDISRRVRRNWESGRQTSPFNEALLYAPYGAKDVPTTYFDDQAKEAARNADGGQVQVFAGPAVRESIWGEAWGLSANISCVPTPLDQLQMIKSDARTMSVNACSTQKGCELRWVSTDTATQMNDPAENGLNIPIWLNESRTNNLQVGLYGYSLLAAADGWSTMLWRASSNGTTSPYNRPSNHDDWTFDHIVSGTPSENITNSMFEVLLWQAGASWPGVVDDETFTNYKMHPSRLIKVYNGTTDFSNSLSSNDSGIFVGMGVHCDVKSAVGTANLDPDKRNFFNFSRGNADPANPDFFLRVNVAPMQIQAVASMAANQAGGNINVALVPSDQASEESTLAAAHRAIGSTMLQRVDNEVGFPWLYYPTLTTENLTLAMYKLLGESAISLMDEDGVDPWTSSDVHALKPARYIRPGPVPWQVVLALLAMWAISTTVGALSTLLFAGPRWAPTLSGFELFKFGAQYQDEVHQFEALDFQGCARSLTDIPGMVGMLPGKRAAGTNNLGFIGLSENRADRRREVKYTFKREEASKVRPF